MTDEVNQITVTTTANGRKRILATKAQLIGKASSTDVLNVVMTAARLQAERLVEKLAGGTTLDPSEVKMLKELAEIAKIPTPENSSSKQENLLDVDEVKKTLYAKLAERLQSSQVIVPEEVLKP